MRLLRFPTKLDRQTVATLGNFDGVHVGHRSLLEAVAKRRRDLGDDAGTALISFYPHPAVVLGKSPGIPKITTLRQKMELLGAAGIDNLYLIHFTRELSSMRPAEFIQKILFDKLNVAHLLIGPDASVGYKREGTAEFMLDYFRKAGRKAEVLPFVDSEGERVSSRRVREQIAAGNLPLVEKLLGRPFVLDARVVRGDGRGSRIGFPTANLAAHSQILPRNGVYAGRVHLDGQSYPAVTNIGVRPTFQGSGAVKVEAHLRGFPGGSIYGRRLRLELRYHIRDERKFSGVDELTAQIERDIACLEKLGL